MCEVVRETRGVIKGQLLTAIQDKNVVAVVLSEADIGVVVEALLKHTFYREADRQIAANLYEGLKQLQREAFGS